MSSSVLLTQGLSYHTQLDSKKRLTDKEVSTSRRKWTHIVIVSKPLEISLHTGTTFFYPSLLKMVLPCYLIFKVISGYSNQEHELEKPGGDSTKKQNIYTILVDFVNDN